MTTGHGLWFVLPVRRGKGLTIQFQSVSCGYAVCSGRFLAGISWSVRGAIVSEGCLVRDLSLHFRVFPLLLFQDMVEACSVQPILGQVLEAFVQ